VLGKGARAVRTEAILRSHCWKFKMNEGLKCWMVVLEGVRRMNLGQVSDGCILPGPKNSKKWPLPGRVFDLPGRGVLRFLDGVYRNPVHFLAILAKNERNRPI